MASIRGRFYGQPTLAEQELFDRASAVTRALNVSALNRLGE